jgi:anti-anti-sigma factor
MVSTTAPLRERRTSCPRPRPSERLFCESHQKRHNVTELRYSVRGKFDVANADDLDAYLRWHLAATEADVLVNCTHLTVTDSSAIRVLVYANQAFEAKGRRLLVANLSRRCRKVFDTLGLSEMYDYEEIRVVAAAK